MLKVGITGGIGSGKTYFATLLEKSFVPVYYADKKAKELMLNNIQLKNEIISYFGDECYDQNGNINRDYVADIIFKDNDNLKVMNNIITPYVRKDFANWCKDRKNRHFVCFESATLYETGHYQEFDCVIDIVADEKIRLKRIKERDPFRSDQEIQKIIDNQVTDKERSSIADIIIINNGDDLTKEAKRIKESFVSENYNIENNITTIKIKNESARKFLRKKLKRNL